MVLVGPSLQLALTMSWTSIQLAGTDTTYVAACKHAFFRVTLFINKVCLQASLWHQDRPVRGRQQAMQPLWQQLQACQQVRMASDPTWVLW